MEKIKTFNITFAYNLYRRNDIISDTNGVKLKVIKIYNSWWRRILSYMGFNILYDRNTIKVKLH